MVYVQASELFPKKTLASGTRQVSRCAITIQGAKKAFVFRLRRRFYEFMREALAFYKIANLRSNTYVRISSFPSRLYKQEAYQRRSIDDFRFISTVN